MPTTVLAAHCPLNDKVRSACRLAHALGQTGYFSKAMDQLESIASQVSRVLKLDQKVKAFAAIMQLRRRLRRYVD